MFLALPEGEPVGIPLAVKDLFDTAGLVTTYGSALFADHVPATTAPAVAALEAAGYAIVGKTNLHEFAYGTTSENPHFGVVPNPLAPGRVAGGSSGGNAAALVLGAADVALGTDSGGSIRIPAACCGIVGFKPTYGLVSLDGCFPLAPSFDHAGPMARDVATCEEAMRVLAPGYEPRASSPRGAVGRGRLARRRRPARAGPRRGGRGALPAPDDRAAARAEGIGRLFMHEVAGVHAELFPENADLYGEDVRIKIERCLEVSDAESARAEQRRQEYRDQVEQLLSRSTSSSRRRCRRVAPPVGAGGTGTSTCANR